MSSYETLKLPPAPTTRAPDGSDVRVLLALKGGSMAHFELAAGQVSQAVTHRTVEEIWYILAGTGAMWRRQVKREDVARLEPGVCLTIPAGTAFQFRADPAHPLKAIAITMPPWPGPGEAVAAAGRW